LLTILCSSQQFFTFMVTLQMPIQQLQGPRESENERQHWNLGVRWNLKLTKTLMGPPPLASASHESAATAKVLNVQGGGLQKNAHYLSFRYVLQIVFPFYV